MQCNHCRKFFQYEDTKEVERKLYNVTIKNKTCPYCGSTAIEDVYHQRYLDKFLKFSSNGIN